MAGTCVQKMTQTDCDSSQPEKLCLQLNCSSDCVHVLRSIVAVMTARAGLDELHSNRVAIAVDEVYANIAAHAYKGEPGRVELETYIISRPDRSEELIFDFRDYASICWKGSFEGMDDWVPDAKTLCPGGLGLRLIHSIADYCDHEPLADGNRWRLGFTI